MGNIKFVWVWCYTSTNVIAILMGLFYIITIIINIMINKIGVPNPFLINARIMSNAFMSFP